ncbi:MAG: helix-turn-helix domain-containing protein [archaeon]
MFFKRIVIHLLLFSLILGIVNYVNSYEISNYKTKIIVNNDGTTTVNESFILKNNSNKEILIKLVPLYDFVLNSKTINYSIDSNNNLKLIFDNNNIKDFNIEFIYLTDYYLSKDNSEWNISYNPLLVNTQLEKIEILLPKDIEICQISQNWQIGIIEERFLVTTNNINNFNLKYKVSAIKKLYINEDNGKQYPNYTWLVVLVFVIIIAGLIIGGYLFYNRKKKTFASDNGKNLLLGLNENEQKIVTHLLKEEGLSQKVLSSKLFLPKGTVSRNITKLQEKGYLEVKPYGVTHKIFLSNIFNKDNLNLDQKPKEKDKTKQTRLDKL